MDPFGDFAPARLIIDIGAVFFPSSRRAGPPDYAEWKKCVRLGKDKKFHGVWDIPLIGDGEWDSHTNELVQGCNESPAVLPPQDAGSIFEARGDGLVASGTEGASGFAALTSQWRKHGRNPWYHIKTYETSSPACVHKYIRVFGGQNQRRQGKENLTRLEMKRV